MIEASLGHYPTRNWPEACDLPGRHRTVRSKVAWPARHCRRDVTRRQ